MVTDMKMAVFWIVPPCSLVEVTNISEMLASSVIKVIALMMEASSASEMLVTSTRIHGTTQNTDIFMLPATRI
jgi:hypothetical protein